LHNPLRTGQDAANSDAEPGSAMPVIADHDRPSHVCEVLERWAAERPDREAVCYGERRWTWAQLRDRVARGATAQRAAGLRPGDRVAVLDLNHPSCLEITLACARAGTANVVVNFRLAPAEVVYVINDSAAKVLFVGPEFAQLVTGLRDQLPHIQRVVQVGDPGTPGDEYEAWLDVEPDDEVYPRVGSTDRASTPAAPDHCFLQLYTSGTTGFPKGAMLTHAGMLAHSAHVAELSGITPDSRLLVAMPLFHVGGSSYALTGLYAGARLVLTRVPDPARLLELLETERITHAFFVPALLALMTKVPGAAERDYSALEALTYGASPMPLPVLRECMRVFPNVFMQVYGMTEACGVVSALGPAEHADAANPHRLLSAGRPIPGVRIEIRDLSTGKPLSTGESGEVYVRTDQLMAGYWNRPDATEVAIDADGWYRSGDAGHLDEDGYLYITDRIKDMIISGGENVYPAEVERVLVEHPAVAEVAVIGVPDERWGEVPKAVVVPAPGQVVDEAGLIAFCRERLAHYKCPRSVEVVDELPRNQAGKVLKKDLRAPYWSGRERHTGVAKPA
jgi:acyl-CoA synthetase (AMP-forming)/AMP-acid ligase II